MKLFFYCQHVLGVGHFFRALEICNALKDHDVVLVTGGAPVDAVLPDHVREIRLPPLMMDKNFNGLYTPDDTETIAAVKEKRKKILWNSIKEEAPDVFLVELYPFGRKAFRFELDPVLKGLRNNTLPPCRVFCSLRDILVEKKDISKYETRVVKTLNSFFDGVFVHSDPELIKLDQTFSRLDKIMIPVGYTGFVAARPDTDARTHIRNALGITDNEKLIIASAGGGSVGKELLKATVNGFKTMENENARLKVFSGPFMDDGTFEYLTSFNCDTIEVNRFSSNFLNLLSASDLSISMAGYNTCMNILAAGVPALVLPFAQNREQRFRAEQIAAGYPMKILTEKELSIKILPAIMENMLLSGTAPSRISDVQLNGAANTARLIHALKGVPRNQA